MTRSDGRPQLPPAMELTGAHCANMKVQKSGCGRRTGFTVGESAIGVSAARVARSSG